MGRSTVEALLSEQEGVVSRRQVMARGMDDTFIETMLRRREWARVHNGVYVNHTGPLTFLQRTWAAVLFYWPAALCHESAVAVHGGRVVRTAARDGDAVLPVVHVAVSHGRRVSRQPGVRVHRFHDLDRYLAPARMPPRVRLEHALLDMASDATSEDAAVAILGHGCQSWATTADRLVDALQLRPKLKRRRLLLTLLQDVAAGTYSALERRYLTDVERPHGLPTGKRQRLVKQGRTSAYRDVEYLSVGLVVELDGRLGHEPTADRWKDLDRDIHTVITGRLTVRVSWGQVLDPCRLAAAVARLLHARGWRGQARACHGGCPVVRGDFPADTAEESPRTA